MSKLQQTFLVGNLYAFGSEDLWHCIAHSLIRSYDKDTQWNPGTGNPRLMWGYNLLISIKVIFTTFPQMSQDGGSWYLFSVSLHCCFVSWGARSLTSWIREKVTREWECTCFLSIRSLHPVIYNHCLWVYSPKTLHSQCHAIQARWQQLDRNVKNDSLLTGTDGGRSYTQTKSFQQHIGESFHSKSKSDHASPWFLTMKDTQHKDVNVTRKKMCRNASYNRVDINTFLWCLLESENSLAKEIQWMNTLFQ